MVSFRCSPVSSCGAPRQAEASRAAHVIGDALPNFLQKVREDTGAPYEGVTCIWMAAYEAGIWNQSENGAVVGKAYIRQRVSGTVVEQVTATTVAGYQDLREFERGIIIGAREMGHSISEIAMKFRFSRMTISQVYREYRESGKTINI
ncbi:uncharacterized protein TNCV_5106821 [Trichonephila clavipes]|uniref:Tc3 transposase DNA binding domain-containing protein n=1 Tax=Trichonephila clavipes TaxID=2585209 RepID=A0A8X6V0U0_TRICX|nr:uncharacterized protein TNCV_5106821 [Trichonephila clavipes]